ncbi:MAG: tyrosine-type recombinase/integrase [Candidatus Geothermarchaeales archaeon]
MSRSFLDEFDEFLLTRGRRDKRTGRPSHPLSPTTAEKMLVMARRILIDLGILGIQCRLCRRKVREFTCLGCGRDPRRHRGRMRWRYFVQADYRRAVRPATLSSWFEQEFPVSKVQLNPKDRAKIAGRKAQYIRAAYKLAEFLHFDKNVWTQAQLDELRAMLRFPARGNSKVRIPELDRIDAFLAWLRPRNPTYWLMLYLMRWQGLRWSEVINMCADLESGTYLPDEETGMVTVYGKGTGGFGKAGEIPLVVPDPDDPSQTVSATVLLRKYLRWRSSLGIESRWMFVKTSSSNPRYFGRKWSEDSGGFNDMIRKRAVEFGFSYEEVRLVSTHKIGRHAYGTWFVRHVDPETLRQNMRHADLKTTEKYLNWSTATRVRNTERALLEAKRRKMSDDSGHVQTRGGVEEAISSLREGLHHLSPEVREIVEPMIRGAMETLAVLSRQTRVRT